MRRRYLEGLNSEGSKARGYTAYFLAQWDTYNKENVSKITPLLDDEDGWIRSMSTLALKKIREAIAADNAAKEEARRTANTRIGQFVKFLPQKQMSESSGRSAGRADWGRGMLLGV